MLGAGATDRNAIAVAAVAMVLVRIAACAVRTAHFSAPALRADRRHAERLKVLAHAAFFPFSGATDFAALVRDVCSTASCSAGCCLAMCRAMLL